MKKEMKKCYETKYCCFCKKKNCDKRIEGYGAEELNKNGCDGNCFECENAFRNLTVLNLLDLKAFNYNLHSCIMYQLIKNSHVEFYGKNGKESKYSKLELALLQMQKCQKCQNERVYYNLLKQIYDKIEEIPRCFESMTNLTSNRSLEIVNYTIFEVLSNSYECKVKIELTRIIKEYLNLNKNSAIDLDKLCDYIKLKGKNIDYYIHPLTVNILLAEIVEDCTIIK